MSDSLLDLDHQKLQEKLGAVSQRTEEMLRAASRWTVFLGIMGFIGCGLCIVACLFTFFLTVKYDFLNQWLPAFYIIGAVSLFFPSLYQIKFSRQLRDSFLHRTEYSFENAMESLRNYFRFRSVSVIALVVFYIAFIAYAFYAAANASETSPY